MTIATTIFDTCIDGLRDLDREPDIKDETGWYAHARSKIDSNICCIISENGNRFDLYSKSLSANLTNLMPGSWFGCISDNRDGTVTIIVPDHRIDEIIDDKSKRGHELIRKVSIVQYDISDFVPSGPGICMSIEHWNMMMAMCDILGIEYKNTYHHYPYQHGPYQRDHDH